MDPTGGAKAVVRGSEFVASFGQAFDRCVLASDWGCFFWKTWICFFFDLFTDSTMVNHHFERICFIFSRHLKQIQEDEDFKSVGILKLDPDELIF